MTTQPKEKKNILRMLNKKTGKVEVFRNREDFDYLCSNSGVVGRWDYEEISSEPKEKKQDDMSLCRSCYCMTKTIEGKCGKCKEKKQDWEKKFRDSFQITDDKFGRERFAEELNLPIKVKDFISSLLEQTREETMEECIEALPKESKKGFVPSQRYSYEHGKKDGFNNALDSCRSSLQLLKNKKR